MSREIFDSIDCMLDQADEPIDRVYACKILNKLYCLIDGVDVAATKRSEALGKILEKIDQGGSGSEAMLALMRCMDVRGVVIADGTAHLESEICKVFLYSHPRISKKLHIKEKDQTYKVVQRLEAYHSGVCEDLRLIEKIPADVRALAESTTKIMRTLNSDAVKDYLNCFGLMDFIGIARAALKNCKDIVSSEDEELFKAISKLKTNAEELGDVVNSRNNFFYRGFVYKFHDLIKACVKEVEERSSDKFVSSILPKRTRDGRILPLKNYPLYEEGREVRVEIPFNNEGPGVAVAVLIKITSEDECLLLDGEVDVGDVSPGYFIFSVDSIVHNPAERCELLVEVSWGSYGSPHRKSDVYECSVFSQEEREDWKELLFNEPYSTEVAEKDEFYGRDLKIANIVKRLARQRMQSTYISGQKRVGKTSLASAASAATKEKVNKYNFHFKFIEWGDYSNPDSILAINSLGMRMYSFLKEAFPDVNIPVVDFNGSLSPLVECVDMLKKVVPDNHIVFVLDEFDEIHLDMYRFGPIAETFFANLRTISSKSNIAFLLIGGENMPFIIGAQGDQLNKFGHEPLSYFSREKEWEDYLGLVTEPVKGLINWYEDAIKRLFEITNGHPYYTKLIASHIYTDAIEKRDSDIVAEDVDYSVKSLIPDLDSNSFSHFWKDGIQADSQEEEELVQHRRCKLLLAISELARVGMDIEKDVLCDKSRDFELSAHEVSLVIDDFIRRQILYKEKSEYQFVLPFFEMWLKREGYKKLIPDSLTDDFLISSKAKEAELIVSSGEILSFCSDLPIYRGRKVSEEKVRAWLDQTSSSEERRLLFKILTNVNVVSVDFMAESLRQLNSHVLKKLPPMVRRSKQEKRKDVAIVYIDGEGKSGQLIAKRYAEENGLSIRCVVSGDRFRSWIDSAESDLDVTFNGIVIVDDIVATGRTMSSLLDVFLKENKEQIVNRNIDVIVSSIYGTKEGFDLVEKTFKKFSSVSCSTFVCKYIPNSDYAFPTAGSGFWDNEIQLQKAKALCMRIGNKVYPKNPLGFADMGLLIVFPENCPNNSLPLLHSSSKGEFKWSALFPRVTHM
ncbi:phosphoribosyltransferase [uncultured Alcanivorax sp.]|jgi:hypothetical protein|uniref:phosphoribosyltransferase n=1 Tax=uncultured Alcanivorax sp. TaxID=191215 RepID=UPI00262F3D3F|nr:phosphoribosyltransferase [uncultured Alcanivorax sp.]